MGFFFLNITKLEEDIITVAVFILLATAVKLIKKRKRVHRQIWTSLWVQRRAVHGAHNSLLHELCLEDPSTLKKFVRIDQQCFAKLWSLLTAHIACGHSNLPTCTVWYRLIDIRVNDFHWLWYKGQLSLVLGNRAVLYS